MQRSPVISSGNVKVETPEELESCDPSLDGLVGRVFTTHHIPMDVCQGKRIPAVSCPPK
jgi:hypothetical protein